MIKSAFKSIYAPLRAELNGRLQLDDVNAGIGWNRSLKDASGDLSWSGGPVSVPVGRSQQAFDVPTMLGQIHSDDTQWTVSVTNTSGDEFATGILTREGLGTVKVLRAIATDMNLPVPGNAPIIFEISQQVL